MITGFRYVPPPGQTLDPRKCAAVVYAEERGKKARQCKRKRKVEDLCTWHHIDEMKLRELGLLE